MVSIVFKTDFVLIVQQVTKHVAFMVTKHVVNKNIIF